MKDQTHLMLDIETMDNGPQSAVVAIGARLFTLEGPGKGFEMFINPTLAAQLGTVGTDTMKWWASQNAQQQVFSGMLHPSEAVHNFNEFVLLHKPNTVWANSPEFDITIMKHLCAQSGLKWPFHYRDARDCRTIFRMGEGLKIDCHSLWNNPDRKGHMPLDDATTQAEVIVKILGQVFSSRAAGSDPGSDLPQFAPEPPSVPPASTAKAKRGSPERPDSFC